MEHILEKTISCAICGVTEKLMRCAKCKRAFYCSIAHQHMDWPNHKSYCRLALKQKAQMKMQQLQQAVAATSLKSPSQLCTLNGGSLTDNQNAGSITIATGMEANIAPHYSTLAETTSSNTNIYDNGENPSLDNQFVANGDSAVDAQQSSPTYQQPPNNVQEQVYAQFNNYNSFNNQQEKSSSYQIRLGDENNVSCANERNYEELCRIIINDMNQYGLSVVDDFLGAAKGLEILNEVHRMYAAGIFQDGQLVSHSKAEQDLRTIRGDKIAWVKGIEPNCTHVGSLINQIDAVICKANTMKDNGKLGNYNIKERTKAMVACYPGSGTQYVLHVDNPNKDGRVITAIYYLNVNWDTERNGGVLRIFPEHGNTIADIEPKFDRLIFFWSDKRNPHEVQPAHRTRYAITVWYFDAHEREAALNRCKLTDSSVITNNSLSTGTGNQNVTANATPSKICT